MWSFILSHSSLDASNELLDAILSGTSTGIYRRSVGSSKYSYLMMGTMGNNITNAITLQQTCTHVLYIIAMIEAFTSWPYIDFTQLLLSLMLVLKWRFLFIDVLNVHHSLCTATSLALLYKVTLSNWVIGQRNIASVKLTLWSLEVPAAIWDLIWTQIDVQIKTTTALSLFDCISSNLILLQSFFTVNTWAVL